MAAICAADSQETRRDAGRSTRGLPERSFLRKIKLLSTDGADGFPSCAPRVRERGRTCAGLCPSDFGFFFFPSVGSSWLGQSGAGTQHAFLCSTRWPFVLLDLRQAFRQVNESHWLAGGTMPPGALFKRRARAGRVATPLSRALCAEWRTGEAD